MTMELTGRSLVGGKRSDASAGTFNAINPATGATLEPAYHAAPPSEVSRACDLAGDAFGSYRQTSVALRAAFLHDIASGIEAIGDALIDRYVAETGLPRGRAEGGRARTCGQLRMFAAEIEKPGWNRVAIDRADADRKPPPKPDTRLRYVPVGPVAVFGPANFPLAFSVAGGDTASALAAGCPVVVKAHSSHPGTSELVAQAVVVASQKNGLPVGVFSVLFGSGREVGTALVDHPAIRAVGFTGSESVGRGLFDQASRRPIPIPVFAEMSSINPVLLLPGALASRAGAIAEGFYPSLTMGVGQFCTNPGLVLLDRSAGARQFVETLAQKLRSHPAEPMLNRGTRQSYYDGLRAIGDADGVEVLVEPADSPGPGSCHATPALLRVGAAAFARSSRLKHEVFGPATLLVECDNAVEMRTVLSSLGGQLTVTIHGEPDDFAAHADLMQTAELLAGRLVFNGFPTGVEVCASMVHGGPYPATTDARFTSVGARAIDRFLRPVCYQNAPAAVLPAELR